MGSAMKEQDLILAKELLKVKVIKLLEYKLCI